MISKVRKYYNLHPLRFILLVGLFFRLLASFFSRGYAFTDDHFFVIEEAFQWMQSGDFLNPSSYDPLRLAHGSLYTFIHFGFLNITQGIPPNLQMFLIRLLHAIYSLLLVKWVFQWAKQKYGFKIAIHSAWIISIFFLFPYLSVRNLVEFVSIPPLFWGMWKLNSNQDIKPITLMLIGLMFSIAFGLRFQTILVSGTAGIMFLLLNPLRKSLLVFIGFLFGFTIINVVLEIWVWGEPLHELIEYVSYNSKNSHLYPNGPWYQYIFLLLGIGLLPFGPLIFFGFLKSLRIDWKWSIPILVFIVFHSLYPNKQERFIFTILPLFLVIGWAEFLMSSNKFLQKFQTKKWQKAFWVTNLILIFPLVFTSTKPGKMDVMLTLYKNGDANKILVENSQRQGREYFPLFYWGKKGKIDHITQELITSDYFDSIRILKRQPPEYVVFLDTNNWAERKNNFKELGIGLSDSIRIYDSWIDHLISGINPIIKKNIWTIFRLNHKAYLPASASAATIETSTATEASKAITAAPKTTSSSALAAAKSTEEKGRVINSPSSNSTSTASAEKY